MIEINRNPSPRELRFFGLLQPIFFVLVCTWLRGHLPAGAASVVPLIIMGISLAIGVVAVFAPARLRIVYVGWMLAVFPIGWVVSHLLLAAIFYLVVTPVGLILRLAGYDAMQRKFERDAKTYWVARPPPPPAQRYFKQF